MSESDGSAGGAPSPDAVALVIEEDDSLSSDEIAFWLAEQLAGRRDVERVRAGIVAGELLDNARLYAAPPYVLQLGAHETRDAVVVAVRDQPVTRFAGWRCGAGLLLVDALSARWGVLPGSESTVVWAELAFE
ncbi:ATP-binding protein [Actinosynnema sp. CA-248983]